MHSALVHVLTVPRPCPLSISAAVVGVDLALALEGLRGADHVNVNLGRDEVAADEVLHLVAVPFVFLKSKLFLGPRIEVDVLNGSLAFADLVHVGDGAPPTLDEALLGVLGGYPLPADWHFPTCVQGLQHQQLKLLLALHVESNALQTYWAALMFVLPMQQTDLSLWR